MSFTALGQFPSYRPRRLRQSAALRRLVRESSLSADRLVLPLFARAGRKLRRPVASMPGVFQIVAGRNRPRGGRAQELGVPAVLLFGIPEAKDEAASGAYARNGIVQQTVRQLKKELPDLLVFTDVCLCEYMSHGHCGIVEKNKGGRVANDRTLKLLARTAVSHAEAGADVVAPSDMMDGRVAAIRQALDAAGLGGHADSFLCGQIRLGLLRAVPRGGGIRAAIRRPARVSNGRRPTRWRRCAKWRWTSQEGADMVMVKPALAYLDILHRVKAEFGYPTAAYAVSGEYSMIKAAAAKGWIDERAGDVGNVAGDAAGRGGFHRHLLGDGSGALA